MKNVFVLAFIFTLLLPNLAFANRQLAMRNGCMSCHADTEMDGPPWPELANEYGQYRGQANAASAQGEKLRKGKLFNNIKAHQKLSPANATELMQWIIDGAN